MSDTSSTNHTAPSNTPPLWRDLLVPLSIIIAGVAIGAGLYFGGMPAGSGGTAATAPTQPAQPEQPQTNTDAVAAVTEADHIKGSLDAPVKIVEYSDFDCSFCARFHTTMNSIVAQYPEDQVAWVYRHFPLEQIHPQAFSVALASECVAEVGGNEAFWTFTDGYFAARSSGDNTPHADLIPQLVTNAGVAEAPFTECYESERYAEDVQADIDNALETGGRGTPWSIIIGPNGNTVPINGALPQQAVEQAIDQLLQSA